MLRLLAAAAAMVIATAALDEREDLKNGRAALRRGDYATAERLLKNVADARPDDWDVRARLVEAELASGRIEEAERSCRDFLFKHATSAEALAALSAVRLTQGDSIAACEAADKSLAADSDGILAGVARAEALLAAGNAKSAGEQLGPLPDKYQKRKDSLMKAEAFAAARGLVLLDELASKPDAYKLAVERILPDILRADNDPAVRAFLGRCHVSRHRREPAEACFKDALAVNTNLAQAHLGQGLLALDSGDFDAAAQSADRALSANPAMADAHALHVRAAMWKLDLDGALKKADEALKKFPKSGVLAALRAAVDGMRGAPKADLPLARYELARALVAARRFNDAVPLFEAAEGIFDARVLAELSRFRSGGKAITYKPDVDSSDALIVDLAKLSDRFGKEFGTFTVDCFEVRVPLRAQRWLEPWIRELLGTAGPELKKLFGAAPPRVIVIFLEKPAEIATLATGVPASVASGVCLGNVIALPMPQPTFSWAASLAAAVGQSFELHRSGSKTVPRWALSGIAAYVARLADFDWPDDLALMTARRDGRIKSATDAPAAAIEFDGLKSAWGGRDADEAFTAAFLKWLDARLAKNRYELPPRPDDRRVTDAESDPKDAAKAVVAAADALTRNQLERAIKFARQAIAADAKCAQGYSLLGQALQKRRKSDEAYEQLKKAAELGADDYRTWYMTGDVLEDLEDAKGAIEAFGKAKAAFPRLVPDPAGESAYRRLMQLNQRAKNADAEMHELAAVVAMEPLNVRDRKRLARHFEKQPEAALRCVREIAWVQPEDKALCDSVAAAWTLKKEHARAIEWRMIAVALIESGQTQDEAADKAAEYCEISELHLALGQKDKAREFAKEALRCVPGLERAQRLYEQATRQE